MYLSVGKRIVDLLLTIPALIVLLPILAATMLLVRIQLGTPVLFRQARPGLCGEPFIIFKFRTMTNDCDAEGNLLPDDERLTRFGRILRSTSLDELPELWNVLKGDMSIVGPRPLLMAYLEWYTPEQSRRHTVKPGITGWAQVNGRNNLKFSERLKMDTWYVDNMSLLLDLKIIFLTFCSVLARKDIRADLDTCLTEVDDCGFYEKLRERPNEKSQSGIK